VTRLKISDTLSLPLDFVTSTQVILAQKGKGPSRQDPKRYRPNRGRRQQREPRARVRDRGRELYAARAIRGRRVTAPIGATVKLYVDLRDEVIPGDIIETGRGRRYGVLTVRHQDRGKHVGRQHLACVVVEPDAQPNMRAQQNGDGIDFTCGVVHRIRWYARPRGKR